MFPLHFTDRVKTKAGVKVPHSTLSAAAAAASALKGKNICFIILLNLLDYYAFPFLLFFTPSRQDHAGPRVVVVCTGRSFHVKSKLSTADRIFYIGQEGVSRSSRACAEAVGTGRGGKTGANRGFAGLGTCCF